jgi:aspartate racemase
MKTIGLIGGITWHSTAEYYRIINEFVQERLGGVHSARCLLWSFDFDDVEGWQTRGEWAAAATEFAAAGRALEQAGAGFLLICANTMHKIADDVQRAVSIPVLHVADATAGAIAVAGFKRVGLLGTRFTMEEDFYRQRLTERHGLEVLVPDEEGRKTVHDVVYGELASGEIRDESRERYQAIIGQLADDGAEAVILGCTEIGLLIKEGDSPLPVFDTTPIHAKAAVEFALT